MLRCKILAVTIPHRSVLAFTMSKKPADLAKILLEKYKIWTVAIDYANVQGVRVTPHLYTSTQELDAFVTALKTLSNA